MSQALILNNLALYIRHLEKKLLNESSSTPQHKEHVDYLKQLQNIFSKRGFCFSFSIIHASMDFSGKLNWWQDILKLLANVNDSALYDQLIDLPDADASAAWRTTDAHDKKLVSAHVLFERVIHYILYHQASTHISLPIKFTHQTQLLDPKNTHFELLTSEGKIMQSADQDCISGFMTKDELAKLLEPKLLINTIALVYKTTHAIRVFYKDEHWCVYDPEYDHTSLTSMTTSFKTAEDAAEEIIRCVGNSITLSITSLEPQVKVSLLELGEHLNPQTVFQKYGLRMIAEYSPKQLPQILNRLDEKQAIAILDYFSGIVEYQRSGFDTVGIFASEYLESLTQFILKTDNSGKHLLPILSNISDINVSGFTLITTYTKQALIDVLNYLQKTNVDSNFLLKLLKGPALHQLSTFELILLRVPDAIEPLIQLLTLVKVKNPPQLIIQMLSRFYNADMQFWHLYAQKHPNNLFQLVSTYTQSDEHRLHEIMTSKTKNGWSIANILAYYHPTILLDLISLSKDDKYHTALWHSLISRVDKATDAAIQGMDSLELMQLRHPEMAKILDAHYSHMKKHRHHVPLSQSGLSLLHQQATPTSEMSKDTCDTQNEQKKCKLAPIIQSP